MSDTAPTTDIATDTANNSEQTKGWRDVLPVHPAAELFPLMSDADLRDLADDIEADGLLERPAVYHDQKLGLCLLEGRNRVDALELLGRKLFVSKYSSSAIGKPRKRMTWKKLKEALAADRDHSSPSIEFFESVSPDDPYAYVLSKNVYRRHLTPDQRRELIAKVLKAKPEASNRQIAKQVKADDKTVAKVRNKLESTAEIPQLEKTTGADGKARPSRKHTPKPVLSPPIERKPTSHPSPSKLPTRDEVVESGPVDALCATLAEISPRNPRLVQACFEGIVARLRDASFQLRNQ